MVRLAWLRAVVPAAVLLAGCAGLLPAPQSDSRPAPTTQPPNQSAGTTTAKRANPQDVERLSRVMIPLLQAANNPVPIDKVKVGVIDDDSINAGNAGGGQFIVTRGLLDRANDDQLRAVLAHEVAHEDLGHVARQQALGTGLNIGAAILDQIFPGTGQIAPVAGTLVLRAYGRKEEYEADRHGVEILKRVGAPPDSMERALVWLKEQTGGGSKGGFFSTHPGTDDRIAALRNMR